MKKKIYYAVVVLIIVMTMQVSVSAQESGNLVHVTTLKMKRVEGGTWKQRDSLIAIYNNNVIKKNDKILSHRQFGHFFTSNSTDYMVVEEYKDFASLEESAKVTTELEKKAWPDEKKRKEFMDAMNAYFENWHGDALYNVNTALSKN